MLPIQMEMMKTWFKANPKVAGEEDDVLAISPLEKEDVLIDVLLERDKATEDPLVFVLIWMIYIRWT